MAAIFGTFACQASNIAGQKLVSLLDNAPNYVPSWVLYPKEKRYILGKKIMELFFEILGLGEKCSISIDGPPSALVADTDTTYLIFGGAAVFLVLCIIIVSILLCRKWSVAKYDAAINRVPEMSRPGSVPLSAGPISGKYTDKKNLMIYVLT